ncbi:MAG: Brp/Blh family beta-carotene 15,15'-dioxygenase [Cyclobacteriaceae bacterium]|uniref:Probable beta-carotene 15,15'-dioxygenase n=1 Tax=Algoriphagus marincola TaxID=264027 RepID=A0ABS7N0J0_9BACT|nr:Brp/Blh family beta-carotene 15,15'-dioxygenase [Algoriphagus marincola]MBY5949841.1 Brp/Blh family beta-carotene 15,15'-dioxygenase [Algoriphagus marincola]MCR9082668.1 Brp/Blh family beta-carotene 15,15'-dioxygenase [Cyclobacteriaceae bacterium]
MRSTESLFKILGLVVCLSFSLIPELPQYIEFGFAGLVLLFVGIPHGAIDHLTSQPTIDFKGLIVFLVRYLSLIGAYLVVWYFLPQVALVIFLAFSAYHFGQTHFLKIENSDVRSKILFITRGSFFLSVILFGDFQMTAFILDPIVDVSYLETYSFGVMGVSLILTLSIEYWTFRKIKFDSLVDLVILAPLLYMAPLFISFVVYFGFWHALPSMRLEYEFLNRFPQYNSLLKFVKQLIPFTLLSLVGISGLLLFGMRFLDQSELLLLFFILISLISFPHVFYMDHFIKKFKTARY